MCFLLVLAVLVGIFCKFGVIDRLNAASEAQAQASAAQAELERLRADNADFETVRVEYALSLIHISRLPARRSRPTRRPA